MPRSKSSWVVDVGAINNAGLYSWTTVSDPAQDTLYVLVRDVEEFKQCCEDDVQLVLLNKDTSLREMRQFLRTRLGAVTMHQHFSESFSECKY
jgi:hypothetical protein